MRTSPRATARRSGDPAATSKRIERHKLASVGRRDPHPSTGEGPGNSKDEEFSSIVQIAVLVACADILAIFEATVFQSKVLDPAFVHKVWHSKIVVPPSGGSEGRRW